MSNESHNTDAFDSGATWYAEWFGGRNNAVGTLVRVLGRVPRFPSSSDCQTLDLGCGVGISSEALAGFKHTVVGIDNSEKSIELAQAEQGLSSVSFALGDATALEFTDERFDLVTGLHGPADLLSSDDALTRMLNEMHRVLKPGGQALLDLQDYERFMAVESDQHSSVPVSRIGTAEKGGAETYLTFERRLWKANRLRDRAYVNEQYLVRPDETYKVTRTACRAILRDELKTALSEAGFKDIEWWSPTVTGHSRWISTARKPANSEPKSSRASPVWPGDHSAPHELGVNAFEEAPKYRATAMLRKLQKDGEVRVTKRRQATLVALSGGIDSVYTLARLLRESDDEIFAHHIHYMTPDNRYRAEAIACQKVVEYLKRTERGFMYTESSVDRHRFRGYGVDEVAVGFEVGIVARSFFAERGYPMDRWTAGICLEEELSEAGATDVAQLSHTLNTVAAACNPVPPPRFFQLRIVPKADQIQYLGPELTEMSWTCRRPIWQPDGTPKECGKCHTCLLMTGIRENRETIRWERERQAIENPVVRAMTRDDVDAVQKLIAEPNEDGGEARTSGKDLDALLKETEDGQHGCFVCEGDGRLVGYLMFAQAFDARRGTIVYLLRDLFVSQAYRRQYVGRALMAALSQKALQTGGDRIDWTVRRMDTIVRDFYSGLAPGSFRPETAFYQLDSEGIAAVASSLPDRFKLR